jgi:hypothetical protein
MSALATYVEKKNGLRRIFGNQPPLDVEKAEDRKHLADCIESELSPENLTCDGELSRTQINKKLRMLTNVQSELEALG